MVYGPHLPAKKYGAYRKKLAKMRRETEGNLRPPCSKDRDKWLVPRGPRRGRRGRRIPRPRYTGTAEDYGEWAMCPLRAGASKARPIIGSLEALEYNVAARYTPMPCISGKEAPVPGGLLSTGK